MVTLQLSWLVWYGLPRQQCRQVSVPSRPMEDIVRLSGRELRLLSDQTEGDLFCHTVETVVNNGILSL